MTLELWQRNPLAVVLTAVSLLVLVVGLVRNGLWSLRLWREGRRIPRPPRAWEAGSAARSSRFTLDPLSRP